MWKFWTSIPPLPPTLGWGGWSPVGSGYCWSALGVIGDPQLALQAVLPVPQQELLLLHCVPRRPLLPIITLMATTMAVGGGLLKEQPRWGTWVRSRFRVSRCPKTSSFICTAIPTGLHHGVWGPTTRELERGLSGATQPPKQLARHEVRVVLMVHRRLPPAPAARPISVGRPRTPAPALGRGGPPAPAPACGCPR